MAKVIGLTGGSGAGKSTVARLFAQQGAEVLDADQIARDVMQPGMPALSEVRASFGADVFRPDGSLRRQALADIVFSDPAQLALLNRITHKYILRVVEERLAATAADVAVIDAAVLIESGLAARCDCVVNVLAGREERISRIMARDGLTYAQAAARIDAQPPDAFYRAHSDFLLDNGAEGIRASQVTAILDKVKE